MLKLPCSKVCPDRRVGCHSSCPKYKDFRDELDRINARRKAENDLENDYRSVRKKHKER